MHPSKAELVLDPIAVLPNEESSDRLDQDPAFQMESEVLGGRFGKLS